MSKQKIRRLFPPDPDSPAARMQRGEGRGPGNRIPTFVPTPEQRHIAMVFAANGATRPDIADALRINVHTLDKYFKPDIKAGKARIVQRVGFVVVKEALAGNMSAARYWLQTHGGPDWQIPKGSEETPEPFGDDLSGEEVVRFYLPENGRDQPEPDPPTIDGTAETYDPPGKTGTDDA